MPNSNIIVWWKCSKCNFEWKAKIYSRNEGNNCPVCANRVVIEGINDLETLNPELAKQWHSIRNHKKPKSILPGSHAKAWWICSSCKYEYEKEIRMKVKYPQCPNCNN